MVKQYVYRVTRTRSLSLGRRAWDEKKVTPMATAQRLGSIRAYNRELPESERWTITVERAEIGEWEAV